MALRISVGEQNASAVRGSTKEEKEICSREVQRSGWLFKNNGIVQRIDDDEWYKNDGDDSHNAPAGVCSDL